METKPYLIFRLHNSIYTIPAERVREIFLLPELIPIVEAPPDIIGLLNFHARVIPVMHLDLRFGHSLEQCHLSDSVIVIESGGLEVGIIVHQVETVNNIDARYIQADLNYGRDLGINDAFVNGIINLDEETIVLLDVDNLIRHTEAIEALIEQKNDSDLAAAEADSVSKIGSFYDLYCPQASKTEKNIFRQRANSLRGSTEDSEQTEALSFAVVSMNGKYFGLDLDIVREFIKIDKITRIPCTPNYIIGNMNLRGEILTLVDISQPLSLEVNNTQQPAKAVVINVDDVVAGIAVEEVFDVVYIPSAEIKPIPVAVDKNMAEYLQGMTTYLDRPFHIINLSKLISQGVLTVELAA